MRENRSVFQCISILRNLHHQVQRLFLRITLDQEERTPISPGKNAHVLEDLVTEAPGVDLRVDVLHQLDHQLGLVEGVQVVPALLPDLPGQLTGGVECGGAEQVQKESRVESFVELCLSPEEGGSAVDAGHDGLVQSPLLKVVR